MLMWLRMRVKLLNFWIKKYGFLELTKLAGVRAWRTCFNFEEVLFIIHSSNVHNKTFKHVEHITVDPYLTEENIPEADLDVMSTYKGGRTALHFLLDKFFKKGAVFWLARVKGVPAGYHWSIEGGLDGFDSFPISTSDCVLFASEVYPEFRGQGVNSATIQKILMDLKEKVRGNFYITCYVWNKANLRSIPKTCFEEFATSRRVRILGYHIGIWKLKQFDHSEKKRAITNLAYKNKLK